MNGASRASDLKLTIDTLLWLVWKKTGQVPEVFWLFDEPIVKWEGEGKGWDDEQAGQATAG